VGGSNESAEDALENTGWDNQHSSKGKTVKIHNQGLDEGVKVTRVLDNLCVVLVGTRNPLNIGAAARAMANFGVSRLRLVRPYEPSFREARSAVGAAELLKRAEEFASVAEAVADCKLVVGTTSAARRELQHTLRPLRDGAVSIRRQLRSGPVALLFGSEKTGLSNEDFSHCHWLTRIPTVEENHSTGLSAEVSAENRGANLEHGSFRSMAVGSMNLGQAVAVCLYEVAQTSKDAGMARGAAKEAGRASARDEERLTQLLLGVLTESEFVKPRTARASEEKLRRMVRRMNLSPADAEQWMGMLRQIGWKLGDKTAGD
jgi:tRNA C32,U32 (ribose-2'-O)-methylase TrmJ